MAESSINVVPLSGGPPTTLLRDPRGLDPIAWIGDRVFLGAASSTPGAGRALIVDPRNGTVEEVSERLRSILSLDFCVHPDGRHVLGFTPTAPGDTGYLRKYSRVIIDLVTGSVQGFPGPSADLLDLDPAATLTGSGGISQLKSECALDGRFIYPEFRNGRIELSTLRPGEGPEPFWTYPRELVDTLNRAHRAGDVGIFGDRIAWVRSVPDDGTGTRSTLLVSDVATGRTVEILSVAGTFFRPTWSRNGRRIALEYEREDGDPEYTLAVVDLDEQLHARGDLLVLDTRMKGGALLGLWSPDDDALIFEGSGAASMDDDGIFVIPVRPGAAAVRLTPEDAGVFGSEMLSPDGTRLAYWSRRVTGSTIVIYRVPAGGGGIQP